MELNIEQILQSERAWEFVLLDIVKSEELNPWDIDLTDLTKNYLERIKKMKELDLRVPARLILAAAILLKMQSDQLVQEEEEEIFEDMFLEEGAIEPSGEEAEEVPLLDLRVQRKPVRKITLEDLIVKLQKSMEPKQKREKIQPFVFEFPEEDITDQLEALHKEIMKKKMEKIPLSDLIKEKNRDTIVDTLLPLLHLANDQRIGLEQENFFEEIYVLQNAS